MIPFFLFLISFSVAGFSRKAPNPGEPDYCEIERVKRINQLKADILAEIDSLPNKDRAAFYANFGKLFLPYDKKEAALWIKKALEIGFSPSTDYKDNNEKINVLADILVYYEVLEDEDELFKKPLQRITEILYDEVNEKRSGEFGEILISLAVRLIKKDEKTAFDLAMLSLKGEQPALNFDSYLFLSNLKNKNEALSNRYFSGLLEVVKITGKTDHVGKLVYVLFVYYDGPASSEGQRPPTISEPQKRDFLELLTIFIQKESEELIQKKRNDCDLTGSYGKRFLVDYRKLLPEKAIFIEQALNICQSAEIDFWKKPDLNRKLKTSFDFINLAKEISDKKVSANVLLNASRLALNEKNYPLAISILDGIDENLKVNLRNWEESRFFAAREFAAELFEQEKFIELGHVFDNTPPQLRHYVILDTINLSRFQARKNKQAAYDLLARAKAEFEKSNLPSHKRSPLLSIANPSRYGLLASLFLELGFEKEAVETFESYVKFQNQQIESIGKKIEKGEIYYNFYFPSFGKDFVDRNFERIYQAAGNVGPIQNRLQFRFSILLRILEPKRQAIPGIIPGIPNNIPRTSKN